MIPEALLFQKSHTYTGENCQNQLLELWKLNKDLKQSKEHLGKNSCVLVRIASFVAFNCLIPIPVLSSAVALKTKSFQL